MIPGRIPNIMILLGTNNVSRGSNEEEADVGIDADVPIYFSLAEVQVSGTDHLHRTNEHENADIGGKEA